MTRRKKRHAPNKARLTHKRRSRASTAALGGSAGYGVRDGEHREMHSLLSELLKITDALGDLERHCAQLEHEGVAKVPRRSIGIVHRMLLRALKTQHVEPMNCKGQVIDLERHEVIEVKHVPELATDIVIEESVPGYMWHARVLRSAKVIASQAEHSEV